MNDKIRAILESYGLDGKEIKVFVFLVANKELTAYKMAKEAGLHRSTVYDVLERLLSKGFVNKVEKRGVIFYSANEINSIISLAKEKEALLLSLAPELQRLEKSSETKIRLLEGSEGHKQFDYNIFNLVKDGKIKFLYIIGNNKIVDSGTEIFIKRLLREVKDNRLHKRIDYKGLWNEKLRKQKVVEDYSFLGQNRFLKDLPSKVMTMIFDDYIGCVISEENAKIIEIKNKLVSEEMKSYFLTMWTVGKPVQLL